VLAPLIAAFASGEAGLAIERAKRAAGAYALALVFVLLGAGFLLIAAYIQAARMIGPLTAALIFGIVFVLIGVVVIALHLSRERAERRRIAEKRRTDLVGLGATAAMTALPGLLRGRRGRATGMAAALSPVVLAVAYGLYKRRRNADEPDL
jgi:uncharacterized membrane protein (DUF485 family)